VLDDPWFEIQ